MTDRKISLKEVTTIDIDDGRLLKDVIRDLIELLAEYGDTAQVSKEQYTYDGGVVSGPAHTYSGNRYRNAAQAEPGR